MATRHRVQNAVEGAAQWGATGAGAGAGVGTLLGGPIGAGIGAGIGGGVGAGVGLLIGLLTSTEQQELEERYARGEIDPRQQEAIADALRRRFYAMQVEQGQAMARRGLTDSTLGARLQAGLVEAEGDALANALADVSMQNQRWGMDMMAQRSQQRAANIGQAVGTLGNLYLLNQQAKRDRDYLATLRDIHGLPPADGGVPQTPQPAGVPGASDTGYTPVPGGAWERAAGGTFGTGRPSAYSYNGVPGGAWQRAARGNMTGGNAPLSGMGSVRNRSYGRKAS